MTVRNIRAHQSRGLLPAPEVRGRTGYYTGEHASRIELIKELQADGFNLEAIRRLLDSVGDASSEVLDFSRALRAPFEEEQPEIIEAAELAERYGRAGRPEGEWPRVRESLERLRPLASEALLAVFQMVMSDAVEETAGRELTREARAPRGQLRETG